MIDLADGFHQAAPSPLRGVLAAIARVVAPPGPPGWLLPFQHGPFLRAVEAIDRFGGVMLALPVGTGKTYLSLAIARHLEPRSPIVVVVPAVLRSQWLRVGERLGIILSPTTHEAVSRGIAPPGSGPVIIDESHRFRNPTTRRYRVLAPALVGRPVILATATPIVNRLADLAAQLLLAVPDDALAGRGVPSLREAVPNADLKAALESIVIRDQAPPGTIPTTAVRHLAAPPDPGLDRVVDRIGRLALARDPAVRRLVAVSLLRAAGSSPAALRSAVERYRRLLGHAERARRAGHSLNRRQIAAAVASDPDQFLLWEVLPAGTDAADLVLSDRASLRALLRAIGRWETAGDAKLGRLRDLLAERRPTVVFFTSVTTAIDVKQRLGLPGSVWVTGRAAGQGPIRMSRAAALGAFDSTMPWPATMRPWLLLATDVAAEGLNLDRIGRVIHYDLPWTAVRLAQRAGRATRLGGVHREVEVVCFDLAPRLEAALALEEAITRKAALPSEVGIGARHDAWRDLVTSWAASAPIAGWATVRAGRALAAVSNGTGPPSLWARDDLGWWSTDPELVGEAVASLHRAGDLSEIDRDRRLLDAARRELGRAVDAAAMARMVEGLSRGDRPVPGVRAVSRRGAWHARARRWSEAATADRALRFLRRGHRAGEAAVARRLGMTGEAEPTVPIEDRDDNPRPARLEAIVLVDRIALVVPTVLVDPVALVDPAGPSG